MGFQRIALLKDVSERRGLCVSVGGRLIGLYLVGKKLHAMESICPHGGYPLCFGDMDGSRIACPAHGRQIDVTTGLGSPDSGEPAMVRYPVRVQGDHVLINLDAPLPRFRGRRPELSQFR